MDNLETLTKTSRRFTEIAELVNGDNGAEYTAAELEERYLKTKDEDQRWAIKRQHF